jgi:Protein of unknown function (DUF2510)
MEVTSISASSYDPESLVPMLDERIKEGWDVISIVSAGTKVVAYLQRDADAAAGSEADAESPVDEPAGWATAPADDDEGAETPVAVAEEEVEEAAPPAEQPAQQQAAAQQAESTVPAGWYADPSGRYELRYWDGNAWTEHVARGGQQYTDPPVA